MNKLINYFLAVPGWRFAYCARTWWRWDVDLEHWDPRSVVSYAGSTFQKLAVDLWPDAIKIHNQLGLDYVIQPLLREVRPILTTATLPGSPQPGSRLPAELQ